ncbi:hypothetical protein ACVW17_003943 [Bradyrhizobium sp. USDA 4473]
MIRKSGNRFSERIMLKKRSSVLWRRSAASSSPRDRGFLSVILPYAQFKSSGAVPPDRPPPAPAGSMPEPS